MTEPRQSYSEYTARTFDIKTGDGLLGQIGELSYYFLGLSDHGQFVLELSFDFGGTHQGLGYLVLAVPDRREYPSKSLELLRDLCGLLGPLPGWKGRTVMVLRETDEPHAPIKGIQTLRDRHRIMWADYFE